jgi:hypothetical protein
MTKAQLMDDDTLTAIVALLLATLVIVFVTLGCVLLAFFWARRLSVTQRALLATAIADIVLVVPFSILAAEGLLPLMGGIAVVGVLGFPAAFLATRKLDRRKRAEEGVAAVFE